MAPGTVPSRLRCADDQRCVLARAHHSVKLGFPVVALARARVLVSDDVTGPACRFQAKVDSDCKAGALTSCTRQCAGTQHDGQGGIMPARAGAHG